MILKLFCNDIIIIIIAECQVDASVVEQLQGRWQIDIVTLSLAY